MKLHLGAFDQIHPGWRNTDVTPHLYVARVPGLPRLLEAAGVLNERQIRSYRDGTYRQLHKLDVTRRFPFPDAAVDAIHISHMLSNLERDNAQFCLNECFRVLKPGGILRVSTMDLDASVAAYNPADPETFVGLMFDCDASKKARYRHWWHYNERSLSDRLRKAGFQEVQRCEYRKGRCPDVETIDSRPGSLFLEATK
jgi:predicted SAM-dependent methyltransferase